MAFRRSPQFPSAAWVLFDSLSGLPNTLLRSEATFLTRGILLEACAGPCFCMCGFALHHRVGNDQGQGSGHALVLHTESWNKRTMAYPQQMSNTKTFQPK